MANILKRMLCVFLKEFFINFIFPQKNCVIPYNKAQEIMNQHSLDPQTSPIRNNRINKKEYDLTIIIPVYNAEKFLTECMDSVLNQKTKYSFHVIAVNDGSTDSSADILERYSKYDNLMIITQTNQGHSGARNSALQEVRGNYVMFVDSDDYLAVNAIETLLDKMFICGADIVQGSFSSISEDGKRVLSTVLYNDQNIVMPNGVLVGMPWGKVYKAELFAKICFPEGYWFEDTIITSIITHLADRIATISDNVYFYRQNSSGITKQSVNRPKSIDTYYVLNCTLKARRELGMKTDKLFYEHLLRLIVLSYKRTKNEPEIIKRSMFSLFKKMLVEERGNSDFKVDKKYATLERMILEGDYRRYCFLCTVM